MKYLFCLLFLGACATKPSLNSARLDLAKSGEEKKLLDMTPVGAQYEFEGYKVEAKECSFIRTMYLDLSPTQTETFKMFLQRQVESKAIMGMELKKQKNRTNPCARLRMFKSLHDISYQGSKAKWGDKGYLVKARLGEAPEGQAFLEIEFFQRTKKDTVRVMRPGYFLSFEKAKEMTDEELVDWIVTTIYHVGRK